MNEDGSRHDPDNERGCGDNHYLAHGLASEQNAYRPQSPSASRFTAGPFGFLHLS
jgi:hypothetical protein